ncbi:hypothetical protein DPMN_074428 [Dreissena polymorpha]|uniref:EF-hand domain-containing protein n=1 Tax=Dreissena polymorpha TaxID=45954 RepID=A0A9D3YEZ6_DREPO|nr:hypothetical protein DPMN_074428 [Dreissena polymorpha]
MNPQYRVVSTDPGDDEDDLCTILIGLLQKDRRKKRKEGLDMLTIGYVIYKMKEDGTYGKGPLDTKLFKFNALVGKSPLFINMREVCGRHQLFPGTYVIIPSTFEHNQQGEFLLMIFAEKAGTTSEMDEGTGIIKDQPAPSVTEDDKVQGEELKESFKSIAGEDQEADAYELRDILNSVFTKAKEFTFDGFSLDVFRSMVAMHDGDLSGKLGFEEFNVIWQDLRKWKAVFKEFDKESSGLRSSYEMRNAFHASGFRLSNQALSAIILRFSNKKGEIEFDDFVLCAIRLNTMIASFKGHDNKYVASYDIESFIQTTMYS